MSASVKIWGVFEISLKITRGECYLKEFSNITSSVNC